MKENCNVSVNERIEKFNHENEPFELMDFENGQFSLGLFLCNDSGPYKDYCQEAFDQYAISADEEVTEGASSTHGSGYDWEIVFKKAFEREQALDEIEFDCEAGGFYCYSDKLEILENLGQRFRKMCDDKEKFKKLVVEALTVSYQEELYHVDNKTVKYYLQDITRAKIEIKTKNHHLILEGGQGREVLEGKNIEVHERKINSSVTVLSKALLHLKVNDIQYDLDNNHVSMEANEEDDALIFVRQTEEEVEKSVMGMMM